MTVFQALVLGAIQGIAEFLPISSSAHLILTRFFFGWPDPGLAFDVALHVGTLVGVVTYFWSELTSLLLAGFTQPRSQEGRLFWYIIAASIPGGLFGVTLEEQAQTVFRTPALIAATLTLMGIGLWASDRWGRKKRGLKEINIWDTFLVGFSQALAIIPGVSRSGITMTAGLLGGLTREAAARFSFLLSVPIIAGAAFWELRHISWRHIDLAFAGGVFTSALLGFLAIKFLLRYLRRGSFGVFAWYRLLLAGIILLVLAWRK
ncbi:Undecaprenyl-diphosphatase [Thermanaeromonas toyohensis ToBE]|uniref:Undecaprenyl-diphosphatase n=1 Tax=Thermanaeromonas toyohensis ToBE TaxID=698762 RepID=A0A1W1VIX9_9FIRM|nr:undecaprenyl-diphosphate phosphatase [Thermanaeromonas toyohensis]SMB92884.1 Undecaprenyl-diphosphatase [Thermanaeromonas toyohensis ToBE]